MKARYISCWNMLSLPFMHELIQKFAKVLLFYFQSIQNDDYHILLLIDFRKKAKDNRNNVLLFIRTIILKVSSQISISFTNIYRNGKMFTSWNYDFEIRNIIMSNMKQIYILYFIQIYSRQNNFWFHNKFIQLI